MALRIVRHPSGQTEIENIFRLDTIRIALMIDLNRSARAGTPEIADERMVPSVRKLVEELAMFMDRWAALNVPEGVVVEVFIE